MRAIAEGHGGRVGLASHPGGGAVFTIDIPVEPHRPRHRPEEVRHERILIVEDEERIASFVEKGLRANGFTTTVVGGRRVGLASRRPSGRFDLVMLDIGLPGPGRLRRAALDARGAASRRRSIMLTARDSVRDTVAGLEGGADDCMTKPFRFEELLARVRLRLRTAAGAPEVTVLRGGDLTLDLRTRRARAGERVVDLTAREFVLLELFLRHPGRFCRVSRSCRMCGGMTSIRGPTSLMCMCVRCGRSLGSSGWRLCGGWGIGYPCECSVGAVV